VINQMVQIWQQALQQIFATAEDPFSYIDTAEAHNHNMIGF